GCTDTCSGAGTECTIDSCGGGCTMTCSDGAGCHLTDCGGGCSLTCDGPRCDIDHCRAGCSITCDRGLNCHIGECTEGYCSIGVVGTRQEGSTQTIASCPG